MAWRFYTELSAASGYGTSLPASPVDGQEFTLVDSLTAPTYQWKFRWNTGSVNTDKWEFVGGSSGIAQVDTAEATSSTTYVALTTPGPSFTVPRSGIYIIELGTRKSGANAASAIMSFDIGGTGAVDADSVVAGDALGSGSTAGGSATRVHQKTIAAAATALVAKYKASSALATTFQDRVIRVTPVRVS